MKTRPLTISHTVRALFTACAVTALGACSGGGGSGDENPGIEADANPADDAPIDIDPDESIVDVSDPLNCNVATQKQWAYDSMLDFYLFYDQVPVVDPQSFDSPNDLVRSVRFAERDDFSRVVDAGVSTLRFDEGREFGLGYNFKRDEQNNVRITKVVPDSPFGRAGVERGDIIKTVNGLSFDDPELGDIFFDTVFGTPEEPASSIWEIEKRDTGLIVDVDITTTEYSIATVPLAAVYSGGALPSSVGYLHFTRFLETSVAELDNTFSAFNDNGIGELILDLRYNGGGRISVARHLASQIAGSDNAGDTIVEYRYNDKYQNENFILDFASGLGDLNLSRVIILTTERSASSSEIVIGGLQPHMEVVTIGTRSTGKPYVQRAYTRCEEQLAVIEAEGFNAAGVSVFGGVPATCYAEDDLTRNFGLDESGQFEGFLQAGIDYISDGSCAASPIAQAKSSLPDAAVNDSALAGYQYDGGALLE